MIVELEDRPTLDSYVPDAGQMAGQSVAQYLAEDRVQAEARRLENQQAAVAQGHWGRDGSQVKVAAQWTSLVNAMAVEIPYGQLEAVQAMDGVKRAYVEHVYDRPVEELGEIDGAYGYSYNMVNLAPAWDAGYTGQGMLVAVLDTGLDLTYTSWGMSAAWRPACAGSMRPLPITPSGTIRMTRRTAGPCGTPMRPCACSCRPPSSTPPPAHPAII